MKPAVATLFCILVPVLAQAVERRVMCFSTVAKHPLHIEFATYEESNQVWTSGYVRFKGDEKPVGIVFQGSRALEDYPDHPSLFRHTWIEVRNERVSGKYQLTSQGAVIGSFKYKNYKSRRDYVLSRDYGAETEDGCTWS